LPLRFAVRGQCVFHHLVIERVDQAPETEPLLRARIAAVAHVFVSVAVVPHVAKSGTDSARSGFFRIDTAVHRRQRGCPRKSTMLITNWRMTMRLPTRTLAAALVAAAIPVYAGSAAAAPLSQSLSLNSADVGNVEQVQYRRWNRGRWIGPAAAGFAAGAIIGGALAPRYYNDGYYAYGAAPYAAPYDDGYYAYGAAPGYYGAANQFPSPQYLHG